MRSPLDVKAATATCEHSQRQPKHELFCGKGKLCMAEAMEAKSDPRLGRLYRDKQVAALSRRFGLFRL